MEPRPVTAHRRRRASVREFVTAGIDVTDHNDREEVAWREREFADAVGFKSDFVQESLTAVLAPQVIRPENFANAVTFQAAAKRFWREEQVRRSGIVERAVLAGQPLLGGHLVGGPILPTSSRG